MGVFIIRKSESVLNGYVLSIKVPKYINPTMISHYLIIKKLNKYILKGKDKRFLDLNSLVTYFSLVRDTLPILLNVEYEHHCIENVNEISYIFI